jgi:flavin-dependent dehydrogenase
VAASANAHFDVAVVGAGPAGSAVTRLLAQAGCRVALVERSRLEAPRVGESLAPGVQPLLAELGVWPAFLALAPLPSYGTRSAWGGPEADEHSHLMTPYLTGWHVDRLAFDRMLVSEAARAGSHVRLGVRGVGCTRPSSPDAPAVVQLSDPRDPERGDALSADLVIDGSGRAAAIARRRRRAAAGDEAEEEDTKAHGGACSLPYAPGDHRSRSFSRTSTGSSLSLRNRSRAARGRPRAPAGSE